MRYLLSLLSLFIVFTSTAQVKNIDPNKLLGTWVKVGLSYLNEEDISDAYTYKYQYTKYTFKDNNTVSISNTFENEGDKHRVELYGDKLYIKTDADFTINKFRIQKLTSDTLVLHETNESYNENPYSLKYTFVTEQRFVDNLPIEKDDVYLTNGEEVIYKASQKIYPKFAEADLRNFFYRDLANKKKPKDGIHVVSFIVNKNGGIDSLKTLKSMGSKFEEMFEKTFKKTSQMWTPAYLNGKPVSVINYLKLRYYSSIGDFFLEQDANSLYQKQEFEQALPMFKRILEIRNDDIEIIYKIGICKYVIGDKNGACEDWKSAKSLGSTSVIPLLKKYCN